MNIEDFKNLSKLEQLKVINLKLEKIIEKIDVMQRAAEDRRKRESSS